MLKRELKKLLKALKKHWIWLRAIIAPVIVLFVLHHLKTKAKKRIRKAVKAKVRERIDEKRNGSEENSSKEL